MQADPTLHFACPGPIDQPTGGYRYDAAILRELRVAGRGVTLHELPGRFPLADDVARAAARRCLAAAAGATLVIDGLALPAFEGLLPDPATRTVALIHHPLALETGIGVAERRHFAAVEPALAQACVGVIVTSPATVGSMLDMGIAQARVAVVEPAVARGVVRRRAAGPRLQLLCVASLTPRKAHRVLIAALGRLRGLDWRLTAIGPQHFDRREAGRIALAVASRGLRGRVRLAGTRPPEAVRGAYARADLFVLPSLHEGYGMAFAEAIASGLPVVGARAGAVPVTVPRRAGILVRPADAPALARALRRLFERGDARRNLRRGAVAAARGFPDWRRQAAAFDAAVARFAS
jgi:glycosyltransferase involved in cell wall biosynthesis